MDDTFLYEKDKIIIIIIISILELLQVSVLTEELNDLYCSPNIVRVIKSRRM